MVELVLVGIDFSESSRQALQRAAEWADHLKVPLIAMHVLQPPAPMLPEAQIVLPDPVWLKKMEDHAHVQLQEWIQGIPHALTLVSWGNPAEELVAEATPRALLVLGKMGHSALERFLFGSTAARVIRHAPCDVLVVRSPEATLGREARPAGR